MASSAVLREVTLTLPMLPDMEIAASKTATALAEFMEMSSDKIDEVRMAVVEACINSFEHSRADDRKVESQFAGLGNDEPERLQITIRDSGVGFTPENLVKPRIEDKLKAASKRGWGLTIIKGLMDEVDIHSGPSGTTVVMSKLR
jgi:serine/threonine-protein kinase RsbW